MSNLISDSSTELFKKIELFSGYDPTQYQDDPQFNWISSATLTEYHAECDTQLREQYDELASELAAIDKNSEDSIELATEKIADDEFIMQPTNIDPYMDNGLSFDGVLIADIFDEINAIDEIVMTAWVDTYHYAKFEMSGTLTNSEIHPFPMDRVDYVISFTFRYIGSGRYDYDTSEFIFDFYDLYAGPKDEYGDRGKNFYTPLTISTTGVFTGLDSSWRLLRSGDTWSINNPGQTIGYELTNGSTGSLNINMLFSTLQDNYYLPIVTPVDVNNSVFDFNGEINMPKYSWSEFTSTQSPNILRAIDELKSTSNNPQTNLYISTIIDSLELNWDEVIDALPNGEFYSMETILALVKSDMQLNNTITSAESVQSIKKIAKTALANRVFIEGANYALEKLGVSPQSKLGMTQSALSALNEDLITAGVTDFEESDNYYNWANIPECNSLDACSRFSTAAMSKVNDMDEVVLHPTIDWMARNYDFIDAELLILQMELDKVI